VAGGLVAAALGPADDRHDAVPHLLQPGPLLSGGELDVGARPLPGQLVFRPVEPGGARPVLPGKVDRVPDPQPPLLRGVNEEQAAERPPCLPAERLLRFLVEQQHGAAGLRGLSGGGQAR
jgi:hypothetical protein